MHETEIVKQALNEIEEILRGDVLNQQRENGKPSRAALSAQRDALKAIIRIRVGLGFPV